MAESIDPGAPKVGFWSKNLYFWAPFWHRFFDFFRKRRKCVISEEYNAKRGSEPSKTSDFHIVFSLNFHVFSEPPLREHFCCVRVPTCAQLLNQFLEPFSQLRFSILAGLRRVATGLSRRVSLKVTRVVVRGRLKKRQRKGCLKKS